MAVYVLESLRSPNPVPEAWRIPEELLAFSHLGSLKKLMSEWRTHTETPGQGSAVEAFPSDLLQQRQH